MKACQVGAVPVCCCFGCDRVTPTLKPRHLLRLVVTCSLQANVAKALLAVLYLDGGYAEAVRPALAQLVAEVLLRPRSGSDSEDGSTAAVSGPPTQSATDVSTVAARPCSVCMSCKDDVGSYVACGSSRCNGAGPTKVSPPLHAGMALTSLRGGPPAQVVGRLLEQALVARPPGQLRQPRQLNLPRGKDDLHQQSSSGSGSGNEQPSHEVKLLARYLRETLGPLVLSLEKFGEKYEPMHAARFVVGRSYGHIGCQGSCSVDACGLNCCIHVPAA